MNIHPRLNTFLITAIKHESSDLHLLPGSAPQLRKKGKLRPVGEKALTEAEVKEMIFSTMSSEQQQFLHENHEIDYAIELPDKGRFRINAFQAQGQYAAAFRLLPLNVQTLEELNLPLIDRKLALAESGLVLVAGSTGSGKSTTVSAMIDVNNDQRAVRIITIENPVETVHRNRTAVISQREVGLDTDSFAKALRSVLRQDPDIIVIGEVRDRDTAEAAIYAAQTGHLVFATIHAGSSEEAVQRYINLFPHEEREVIRETLAVVLNGIVVQKLIMDVKRTRIPVQEVLVNTDRVSRLIRDAGHGEKYKKVITEGEAHGMQTMEQVLVRMVRNKQLDASEALKSAPDVRTVRTELRQLNLLESQQA